MGWAEAGPGLSLPLHTEDLTPELLLQYEASVKRLDLVANTESTLEEDKVKMASEVGGGDGGGGYRGFQRCFVPKFSQAAGVDHYPIPCLMTIYDLNLCPSPPKMSHFISHLSLHHRSDQLRGSSQCT